MSESDFKVVSSFFTPASLCSQYDNIKTDEKDLSDDFLNLIEELNMQLKMLHVPSPVDCIYNATEYARQPFEMYVRKYCSNKKVIMYFGTNPGPWGMSQTGVPFGEVNLVKNWLSIEAPVDKPPRELKSRPVLGFDCTRSEISGKRFWSLIKSICGSPEIFFKSSFVYNYLPQQWMKSNGCNVTPSDFKVCIIMDCDECNKYLTSDMKTLYDICDPMFIKILQLFEVQIVIAIGKFCETRAKKAIEKYIPSSNIAIHYLPHPSPRTVNNNDWDKKALEHLKKFNILHYYEAEGT